MNEEIADLQQRVAFQDDAIAKMSDQIALQDKELMVAKVQIQLLREKMLQLADDFEHYTPSNGNERPPHY